MEQSDFQPKSIPSSGPRYPGIKVSLNLKGPDGNAFCVMGAVQKGLENAGHGDQVKAFLDEAMSGDYDNVIDTCKRWVDFKTK